MIVNTATFSEPIATPAPVAPSVTVTETEIAEAVFGKPESSQAESELQSIPASEETAQAAPMDEALFWRQMDCLAEMSRIEIERTEVEIGLKSLKEKQKTIEKSLAEVRGEVSEAEGRIRELTDDFLDQARSMVQLTSAKELKLIEDHNKPTEQAESKAEESVEDESWRSFPITELFKSIPGQKAKKEKLADQFETVGQVQDARIEASLAHKQFKEVLPKGCGEGFATAIEDAIIALINRWNKEKFSPAASAINLEAIANDIRNAARQNEWTKDDCKPKDSDSDLLKAGFAAFNASQPMSDAPKDSEHEAKQWLTGWVSGEILKALNS